MSGSRESRPDRRTGSRADGTVRAARVLPPLAASPLTARAEEREPARASRSLSSRPADRTRPDRTRPDRTRPDTCRPDPRRPGRRPSSKQVGISGVGIVGAVLLCLLLGGVAGAMLARGDTAVVQAPSTTTTVTSTLTERVAIFTEDTAESTETVAPAPTGSEPEAGDSTPR